MKNIKALYIISLLSLMTVISSCKKDPDEAIPTPTPAASTGSVLLHFKNTVGDSALILNTSTYVNANSDTFNVSKFNYYISNIKLTRSDLSVYTETESYHLLEAENVGSSEFVLNNVPVGDYIGIQFTIGVDSTRNVSGAQTGALDPANGMFWSWNSGYIMAKFEGTSSQSTTMGGMLIYHLGGFSGTNSVLKTVSPSFNSEIVSVSRTATPEIHMKTDLLEWFTSPSNISFATLSTIHMSGANAKLIADNYANMLSVEEINN